MGEGLALGWGAILAGEGGGAGVGHVLDRDDDLQVELLGAAGVDDLAVASGADEEPGDPVQRSLGGGEAYALEVVRGGQVLEALQGEGEVGASLGLGYGVDLVDDHRLGRGEDLAGARGEHQVEGLGGGDEDVRRVSAHRAPLGLGGVAGAQADRDVGADPPQRRPQVALDVVGEGLQRRDVDEPHPGCEVLAAGEPIDPPEEGGQRLARAGRRADQRIGATGDRLPATHLRGRRLLEGGLEPAPDRRAERRQRVGFHGRIRLGGQPTDLTPRKATAQVNAYEAAIGPLRVAPPVTPAGADVDLSSGCRRRTSRRRTRPAWGRSRRRRGRCRRRSCRCRARRRPRTSRPA